MVEHFGPGVECSPALKSISQHARLQLLARLLNAEWFDVGHVASRWRTLLGHFVAFARWLSDEPCHDAIESREISKEFSFLKEPLFRRRQRRLVLVTHVLYDLSDVWV
jgi:hypothetical protein